MLGGHTSRDKLLGRCTDSGNGWNRGIGGELMVMGRLSVFFDILVLCDDLLWDFKIKVDVILRQLPRM